VRQDCDEARLRRVGQAGLLVEVEAVEGHAGAEPGRSDPWVGAGGVAGRYLMLEDSG